MELVLLLLLAQLSLPRLRNSCCSLPLLQSRYSDDHGRTATTDCTRSTDTVVPGGRGQCRKTSGGERGLPRGSAGNRRRRRRCCGHDRSIRGLQQPLLLKLLLLLLLLLNERVLLLLLLLLLLQERLVLLLLVLVPRRRRGLQGLYGSLL